MPLLLLQFQWEIIKHLKAVPIVTEDLLKTGNSFLHIYPYILYNKGKYQIIHQLQNKLPNWMEVTL